MKIMELTGNDRWHYAHLIPHEYRAMLHDPARTVIGAYTVKHQIAYPKVRDRIIGNMNSDDKKVSRIKNNPLRGNIVSIGD